MSSNVSLLCIDLQNDFSSNGGSFYKERPSVQFATDILFPYLMERKQLVAEVISDYRQPRPGDDRDCCRPGEWGYESILPPSLRKGKQWIKSMNSPVWTRNGIGDPESEPGEPYPDPNDFGEWLNKHVGPRDHIDTVIVFGLTVDCCVLAAVQELRWRGYNVRVLEEATDLRSGDQEEKAKFLSNPPFTFWGSSIRFDEFQRMLK